MVNAPAATPVTTPDVDTEPVAEFEEDHVPPPVAHERVVVSPLQTVAPPVIAATVGMVATVIETLEVLLQPLVSIPVTVYVVVTEGLAVTDAPVPADKEVAGSQL